MQVFNKNDYASFKALARMDQDHLHNTLNTMLSSMYPKDHIVATQNYTYAIGDIPICLVAHMDTVFTYPPKNIFYDREKNVVWSPEGLGADDRAGVFAILKILAYGYRPHVIFTTDEEIGCIGAEILARNVCPFTDCRFLIQLDRAHKKDCVFYYCENYEFQNFIEKYGFDLEIGSFSDISELCPRWGIAGVNLSIGYVNEHSPLEMLYVSHMFRTIKRVIKILQDTKNDLVPFFEYKSSKAINIMCHKCHKVLPEYMMIPTVASKDEFYYLCDDCAAAEDVDWCEDCGKAVLPGLIDYYGSCPICRENGVLNGNQGLSYDFGKSSSTDYLLQSSFFPGWDDDFEVDN